MVEYRFHASNVVGSNPTIPTNENIQQFINYV